MLTQKQWKIQYLAGFMMSLATSGAIEAARKGALRQHMVLEHAIIAEEARNIASSIMEALEQNIYGGLSDNDFDNLIINTAKRTTFLALNAALVACKVFEHKPMAVFADEMRTISIELSSLYGLTSKYADIPSVSPKSSIVPDVFYIFTATSGKYTWWENAHFVVEVLNYEPDFIQNNRFVLKNAWRDMDMPLIVLGDVPEEPGIVIISDAQDPNKKYAVLAQININVLINSHVGVSMQCTSDIPVRECWSASDGSELIFPDWGKLCL